MDFTKVVFVCVVFAAIPSHMHNQIMENHNVGVCEESLAFRTSQIDYPEAQKLERSVCEQSSIRHYGANPGIIWIIYTAILLVVVRNATKKESQ